MDHQFSPNTAAILSRARHAWPASTAVSRAGRRYCSLTDFSPRAADSGARCCHRTSRQCRLLVGLGAASLPPPRRSAPRSRGEVTAAVIEPPRSVDGGPEAARSRCPPALPGDRCPRRQTRRHAHVAACDVRGHGACRRVPVVGYDRHAVGF